MKFNLYFFDVEITSRFMIKGRIVREIEEQGFVPAVKLHRQLTGSSLKDAHRYAMDLRNEGYKVKE